jgi:hypothetical protein
VRAVAIGLTTRRFAEQDRLDLGVDRVAGRSRSGEGLDPAVNGDKGLFVAMPSRKLPNGDFRDICHPISTEARNGIQDAVLSQFNSEGGVSAFAAAAEGAPALAEI